MRAVVGPRGRLRKYVETLRRVLAREHRAANEDELRRLYAFWDEAHSSAPAGIVLGPLSSRDELEDEFGAEPEPHVDLGKPPSGGAPLRPVMLLESARQLQTVIDRALENGTSSWSASSRNGSASAARASGRP